MLGNVKLTQPPPDVIVTSEDAYVIANELVKSLTGLLCNTPDAVVHKKLTGDMESARELRYDGNIMSTPDCDNCTRLDVSSLASVMGETAVLKAAYDMLLLIMDPFIMYASPTTLNI